MKKSFCDPKESRKWRTPLHFCSTQNPPSFESLHPANSNHLWSCLRLIYQKWRSLVCQTETFPTWVDQNNFKSVEFIDRQPFYSNTNGAFSWLENRSFGFVQSGNESWIIFFAKAREVFQESPWKDEERRIFLSPVEDLNLGEHFFHWQKTQLRLDSFL